MSTTTLSPSPKRTSVAIALVENNINKMIQEIIAKSKNGHVLEQAFTSDLEDFLNQLPEENKARLVTLARIAQVIAAVSPASDPYAADTNAGNKQAAEDNPSSLPNFPLIHYREHDWSFLQKVLGDIQRGMQDNDDSSGKFEPSFQKMRIQIELHRCLSDIRWSIEYPPRAPTGGLESPRLDGTPALEAFLKRINEEHSEYIEEEVEIDMMLNKLIRSSNTESNTILFSSRLQKRLTKEPYDLKQFREELLHLLDACFNHAKSAQDAAASVFATFDDEDASVQVTGNNYDATVVSPSLATLSSRGTKRGRDDFESDADETVTVSQPFEQNRGLVPAPARRVRPRCFGHQKLPWTAQEKQVIREGVVKHGYGRWIQIFKDNKSLFEARARRYRCPTQGENALKEMNRHIRDFYDGMVKRGEV